MVSPRFFLPARMKPRVALLLFGLFLGAANSPQAAKPAQDAPYRGAIVLDASSGKVLFEENADVLNPPASVTKLMTFLIVHDRIEAGTITLDTPITITAEDSRMGGTQVWLEPGEVFTVEELLFALIIQSANDAASALARTAAGSRELFVEAMNARAKALGMTQTQFRTPHGLPPPSRKTSEGDLTSPRDLSLLSRELLLHTDVLRFTRVKERTFRPGQPAPREVIMRTHNHLIARVQGVDGLKTGFTNAAGFCLAATAEREGRRVIAVVMGSPSIKTRDIKVAELIERGFAQLPQSAVFRGPDGPTATSAPPISPASPASHIRPADEADQPTVRFTIPKKS